MRNWTSNIRMTECVSHGLEAIVHSLASGSNKAMSGTLPSAFKRLLKVSPQGVREAGSHARLVPSNEVGSGVEGVRGWVDNGILEVEGMAGGPILKPAT